MIEIILNGDKFEVKAGANIADLLAVMGAECEQVAVMINGEIITKTSRKNTCLQASDRVEVLRFAGGG